MSVVVTADPTKGVKLDAAVIAAPFREEIRKRVQELKQQGLGTCVLTTAGPIFLRQNLGKKLPAMLHHHLIHFFGISLAILIVSDAPLLVGLLANRDPAAKKYAEWTGKACQADGLRYELRELDDPLDVETALIDANDDPRVHGIIVYYPIFAGASGTVMGETFSGQSRDDYLRDTVSFKCDVEGLCHTYRTNLYRNVRFLDYPRNEQKCVLPCTALSVVKILEHCPGVYDRSKPVGKQLEGKTITVINRSEIVGRPLAAMLANDGATVYSVDINSIFLLSGNGQRMHHATGETPESCVRKVSVFQKRDTFPDAIVTGQDHCDARTPSLFRNLTLSSFPEMAIIGFVAVCSRRSWSRAFLPKTIVFPLLGFNRPQPWSTFPVTKMSMKTNC